MLGLLISLGFTLFQIQAPGSSAGSRANVRAWQSQAQLSADDISQLRAQAELGSPIAQLKLARAYKHGDGVPQNDQIAAEWYRKVADQGNAEAQNSLGEMYLAGQGVEQNKQQAVIWYRKSARQGNANAMYNLGAAYYNGDGVDVNDSFSYAWFILAKGAGSQRAAEAVQRAESELRAPAIIDAFKKIAEMYERGEYLPENQAEAAGWWLKAATRGDKDARIAIASKLINGQGVAQDFTQGRYLCTEAAKQRDARGEYCMGCIYQGGLGVTRDAKEARKWFERAARGGYSPAIKTLAQMEASGEGGKIDRLAACLLYARLAARGDKDALRSLARLKKEIGAKEWKKVQKHLPNMLINPEKLDTALQQVDPQ